MLAGHIPVLLDAVARRAGAARRRRLCRRHLWRRRLQRGAARRGALPGLRHRPRSRGGAARRRRWPHGMTAGCTLIEGRFGDMERLARAGDRRPDRRHRARSRRLVDPARQRRARLLVPPRRPARHAHEQRRARAPPIWSRDLDEDELAELIRALGEERFARRVARAIVAARQRRADPAHRRARRHRARGDPAGASPGSIRRPAPFRRLRIAVNDELGELDRGLAAAERLLMPGGRLAVVSFHSLEDRAGQKLSAAAQRRGAARLAPSARRPRPRRRRAFTLLTRRAVRPERRGDRPQPARPLGAAARRRAHRGAALAGRDGGAP